MMKKLFLTLLCVALTAGSATTAFAANTDGMTGATGKADSTFFGAGSSAARQQRRGKPDAVASATRAPANNTPAPGEVDLAAAKTAAYTHAGVTADQVTFVYGKWDTENRMNVYDLEFYTATVYYEYQMKAADATVCEYQGKLRSWPAPTSESITEQKAKDLALAQAGLKADQLVSSKVEYDKEDGRACYEVKLSTQQNKYTYLYTADSGTLVEWEIEKY